jgi:DNA-binding LacI/PurR family transcriptional regulator
VGGSGPKQAGGEPLPPTLEDVAQLAGVSRATVSRVVNGARLVAPATVEQVRAAIEKLQYQPNPAARALVTRRTGVIAVVVPEAGERVFADPFFPQLYRGALVGFHDTDLQVVLVIAEPGDRDERVLRYLGSGHVDGAIVASHHGPALGRALAQMAMPSVFVGDPEIPGLLYADIDQQAAARRATEFLMSRGARRLGSVTGPLDMAAAAKRLQGFDAAVRAAGLSADRVESGGFTVEGGLAATRSLLQRYPDLDGLFVASDLMATGALQALREAGRRVPDDVRVVGFDDSALALQSDPALTTMTNPASLLASEAARLLIGLLSGERPGSPVFLTSELVVRDSA